MTDSQLTECVICIGSNCGDRRQHVVDALRWLSGILVDFRHSHIYATPDCHGGQREYINAIAIGKSQLKASDIDALCKAYELANGRDAASRAAGDVPVDIDIVVFGAEVVRRKDFDSEFFEIGFRQLIHS